MLLGLALRLSKEPQQDRDSQRVARWGAWIALIPSLAQMLVGPWLIAVLPPAAQQRLLGEDWPGMIMLGVSVIATFALLQDFASIALGEFQPTLIKRAMALLVLIVVLMTGTLNRLHAPQIPPTSAPVSPANTSQHSPTAIDGNSLGDSRAGED